MASSDSEDFSLCGPTHLLKNLDWNNEDHQRCVAASLVQGIYIVERDRQLKREGSEALASPWWESFSFKLIRNLIDDADFSIFGGIYEHKPPETSTTDVSIAPPRYVIAFRGTLTKPDSISRDIELDIHIIRNGLHRTSRFEIAMQAVRSMAGSSSGSSLWLTGHSMGAAMALLAGKTLAKTGIHLKSFLFNPPFVSPPIERIGNEKVRQGIRIAGSIITAGLALSRTLKQTPQQQQQQLRIENSCEDMLCSWLPEIYVNPGDHLCSEYIGFFEHRGTMDKFGYGAGMVERMAMQHSLGGLLMDAMGVNNAVEVQEPVHVIPSAKLIVNRTTASNQDYKEAHGIHQWWKDDQDLVSNIYLFTK
ncbi:unnamed protein product [Microthlaspi erraticum]|uniref:Fungal lipase-type domain-containing protein n=1 Tax=Microthlaspi erraticum TaxID=1685480 RepID=A0A6D2HIG5_9BRAS|nr:unnamed protein product [Microthlaspi erraticum]